MENNLQQNNNLASPQQSNNENEGTEISFRSIWQFLTGNWFWFMISVVFCLCLGFLYSKISPKVYSSASLIYVDENASRSVKSDVTTMTNLRMMRQTSVVDNEAAILRSQTLMQKVVDNLDLNVVYRVQAKLRKVEIYAPTAPAIVKVDSLIRPFELDMKMTQSGVSGIIEYTLPGNEKVEERFAAAYGEPISGRMGNFRVEKNRRYGENFDLAIEERDRLFVTVHNPKLYARSLSANLSVSPSSKTTSLIVVGMKSAVPQKSADIVNELIYVYNEDAKEGERAVARATMEFVDERLLIVGADLEAVDSNVENYRKSAKSVSPGSEASLYVQAAAKLEEEAVEIETQIRILDEVYKSVQNTAGKVELVPNLGVEDVALNKIITDYNTAVLEYNAMGGERNLSNPSVENMRQRIISMQSLLPASIDNIRNSLKVQLRAVERQIADNELRVSNLPTIEKGAQSILRDQKIKEKIYEFLLNKREETSLKLATTAPVSRVIDPAEPAIRPIAPRTSMIMLLALILGFILPVVVIFIAEALRTKIYAVEEVEAAIGSQVPIVGAIPSKESRHTSDVMVTPNSRDSVSEAFRMVRTNVDFMMPKGGQVIMVTSTVPSEGKTTVALNIALSFVITGKKVIIVDMDMRKGSMEKRVGASHHSRGIVTYLVGKENNVDNLIVKDCVHGVDALFVGTIPPNPAELLMRSQLDELFEELKKNYDYIIVDTAPIALVTDTMIVNRYVRM